MTEFRDSQRLGFENGVALLFIRWQLHNFEFVQKLGKEAVRWVVHKIIVGFNASVYVLRVHVVVI